MERVSYFSIFRRRWWVIALCILLSVGAVLAVARPGKAKGGGGGSQWTADTILIDNGHRAGGLPSLRTVAVVTTLRPVTVAAAKALNWPGDPSTLLPHIAVSADPSTGLLRITGTYTDPTQAAAISTAFSTALLDYLKVNKIQKAVPTIDTYKEEIKNLQSTSGSKKKIADLKSKIAQTKANAAIVGIDVFQKAVPVPVLSADAAAAAGDATKKKGSGGKSSLKILQSIKVRIALAVLLGLVIGCILSLILEHLDGRLRTTRSVIRASDLPVLGEVPELPRAQRKSILVAEHPLSKGANAFRILAAAVSRSVNPNAPSTNGHGPAPMAVLVTSAVKGEGKTTVAANLAAAFAEANRSVIVIAGDLRDSNLHRYYHVADQPGLCDVLSAESGETLAAVRQLSGIKNVTVVGSGGPCDRPGALLSSDRMKTLLTEARSAANVVIVDTTGMLDEGDAVDLLPRVDAVVVVARAGQLKGAAATSIGEMLSRLHAPNPGLVVNGQTEPTPGPAEPVRELEPVVELR